ncbi:MAG: Hsp20/alpha crystallin family protein [Sulfurovum sp.]|nr:Hsp20/alpha crystallin family protein [Sulfurovum sp.]MDD3602141.1 Hsp20/alpha crystallin family protein [Sulfurovum sp.]
MKSTRLFPFFIISTALGTSLFAAQSNVSPMQQINSIDDIFERQIQRMQKMQEQMDKMFEEFDRDIYNTSLRTVPIPYNRIYTSSNISSALKDKGDSYEISVSYPKDSKIDIVTKNHQLTVQITQEQHLQRENNESQMRSYTSSASIQSFSLPLDADTTAIKSKVEKGYLIISIAKMVQKQNIVPAIQPEQNDITKPMLLKPKETNTSQPASTPVN